MRNAETIEELKRMKEFVRTTRPDLVMTKVPPKALKEFKDFATDNFSRGDGIGDYGMALKHLLDSNRERIKILENFNDIFASMNDLHKRLLLLEDKPEKTETLEESARVINLLDGHKIEVEKKR